MKVRNLKANHNSEATHTISVKTVTVRNLKANHNGLFSPKTEDIAVLASMKVQNLKANHNDTISYDKLGSAVLASVKVRNQEANHNRDLFTTAHLVVIVIGCWSAYG